jgi:hypothetical protein
MSSTSRSIAGVKRTNAARKRPIKGEVRGYGDAKFLNVVAGWVLRPQRPHPVLS